jgi:hypothetical protein
VEFEQGGAERAGYGEELPERLAVDLTSQRGRGFSRQNLHNMRQFYFRLASNSPDTVWRIGHLRNSFDAVERIFTKETSDTVARIRRIRGFADAVCGIQPSEAAFSAKTG